MSCLGTLRYALSCGSAGPDLADLDSGETWLPRLSHWRDAGKSPSVELGCETTQAGEDV